MLEDKRHYYAFEDIEIIRKRLLKNNNILNVNDLGAGSRVLNSNQRSIRQIARTALSSPDEGKFLFKLLHHLRPQTIIELGTSLGISALYMSKALPQADITSIEGCPEIAAVAKLNIETLESKNVTIKISDFKAILPQLLAQKKQIDCIFIDGNHQYQPTMDYLALALPYLSEDGFLVFDDIYWSPEMTRAWLDIKAHKQVTLTIDTFNFGIAFVRKAQLEKEHFQLVPTVWKFWKTGLWG